MKKNVKTLWALVLTLAMVLSTNLVLPAQAAETADSSLTYELDFSEVTATGTTGSKGLKSTQSINAAHYVHSTDDLVVNTYKGVKALELDANTGIRVQSNYVTGENAFDAKNLSFEMWVYKNSNSASKGNFLRLSRKTTTETEIEMYFTGSDSMKVIPFYGAPSANVKTYKFSDYHYTDDWEHIVITRTYDEAGTTATTKIYSNGVERLSETATGLAEFVGAQKLEIGAYASSNSPDIALGALRAYEKELTASEVKAKYDAEKDKYGVGLRDERMVYELDFSGLDQTSTAQGARGLKGIKRADKYVAAPYIHGTAPLSVEEKNGVKGLNFNAQNGIQISSGTNADGLLVSEDLSVEMWIYKKNAGASGPLVKLNGSLMQMYYESGALPTATNKMQIIPNGSSDTKRNYTFSDYHYVEDWEHIILTRDYNTTTDDNGTTVVSATTKLYANGVLKDTYSDTNLAAFSKPTSIQLGCYAESGDISTLVGDFRIFDAVLSPEDVAERYDLQKEEYGVENRGILTYDLDFSDYATEGLKNKTTTRGITINQHYNPNPANITVEEIEGIEALKLGAAGGFLIDSTDGSAFGSKDLTIEMWAYKYDGFSKGNLFKLVREKTSTGEMEMYFMGNDELNTNSSVKFLHSYNGFEQHNYTNYYETDAWQHIVFTRTVNPEGTSATTKVYVNGKNVKTYTNENTSYVTPQRLFVGDYGATTDVNAALATFKVYNEVLSADEIKAKFLEEAPNYNNVTYYANGAEIDELNADMTAVKSSVWVLNTENKAVDMKAFAAVYQNDVLVKVVPAEQTVLANDVWNFDIPVEDITVDANTEIKTFVWTKAGMMPVYSADDQVIQCL